MAEEKQQKQQKKKGTIVKRIFKWFGLSVLALLLALALVFQAPWKVITLLVIFLLACTVLPKQLRKWFWLSVGVIVIALIVWVFLPDKDGDWRSYTFDEELAALEAKYAIADGENAATIYNQLLDNYDANAFEPNLPDDEQCRLPMKEPWQSTDCPEIAGWLQQHQVTMETLLEASKIEKCRFPITASLFHFDQRMDQTVAMKRWAHLLLTAANNDLGEGRIKQALEKYTAILQMAKHQFQQPAIIDMLVGIAIEALAIQQFDKFIVTADTTEEHLTLIEEALLEIKHNWATDWPKIVEYEKLLAKNMLGMFYEVNPQGKIRFNRNLLAAVITETELQELGIKESHLYWRRKLCKAHIILYRFYMPSTPQKAGEIFDAACEKYSAMAEPDFDWQKDLEEPSFLRLKLNFPYLIKFMVDMLEPPYYRVHDLYLRLMAERNGCQLLIALRRYKNENGHWPESLDQIRSLAPAETFVDPINGSSFVYKLTEENFTLYSKGENNIDDGGRHSRNLGTSCAPQWVDEKCDDRLIWPPKGRKTKKEGADAEQQ